MSTHIRVNGAIVIKSAESRPKPVVAHKRIGVPPVVSDADRALARAVLAHHRR